MTTAEIENTADLINQVIAETEPQTEPDRAQVTPPPDTVFTLPGGYVGPDGYVATEVEVKELTGRDEESISRAKSTAALMQTVIQRGLVRVGDREPDDMILNNLLAGDRDFLMLKIFGATFGNELFANRTCTLCGTEQEIVIDADADIPTKTLSDPSDRNFSVKCRAGEARVTLPTGSTQKLIQDAEGKTFAELSTLLLANTVISVGGREVLGSADVLDLSIKDRRLIADEIGKRAPGPQLQDIKASCSSCGEEMEVPLSMAALFQF